MLLQSALMHYICIPDMLQMYYISPVFFFFYIHNSDLVARGDAVSDDSPKLWLHHISNEISSCQRRKFHWTTGRFLNFPLKAAKQAAVATTAQPATVLRHYAKIFKQCELEVKD